MTLPKLPPNSTTLRPTHRKCLKPYEVDLKYKGQLMTSALRYEVRADLEVLRQWDDYERHTHPDREEAKAGLRRVLERATC